MGAADVETLVVRARPEGVDETAGEIGRLESSVGDTTDAMDDQGEEMQAISRRWQGAMQAIVAGLAVAAAGLLSKVPVVGELFGGLEAVISAVAFQMDQVLRPALQPVTDALFDLSEAIFEAEGPTAWLIGALGSVAAVAGLAAGLIASYGFVTGGLAGAWSALAGAASFVASAIAAVASSTAIAIAGAFALAFAIGTLLGLIGTWILDTLGVLDAVERLGEVLSEGLPEWLTDAMLAIGSIGFGMMAMLGAAIIGFIRDDWQGALEEGAAMFEIFRGAIMRTAERLKDGVIDFFSDLGSAVAAAFRQAFDAAIPSSISLPSTTIAGQTIGGGTLDLPQLGSGGARSRGGGSANSGDDGGFLAGGSSEIAVMLDGRRVDEATRKFRGEEGSRRGRFG